MFMQRPANVQPQAGRGHGRKFPSAASFADTNPVSVAERPLAIDREKLAAFSRERGLRKLTRTPKSESRPERGAARKGTSSTVVQISPQPQRVGRTSGRKTFGPLRRAQTAAAEDSRAPPERLLRNSGSMEQGALPALQSV